jgi:NAD-dependent deacetylase
MKYERQAAEEAIREVRRLIHDAQRVVVLTGAGISTDSGIRDFRGPHGLWTENPLAEKMATLHHYMSDPEIRKRAWKSRLDSASQRREPNDGHRALVTLERQGKLRTLITQNTDGLHQKAGSSPEIVVEIHGNTREVLCTSCGDRLPIEQILERVRAGEDDPHFHICKGVLKSATISFGQPLVEEDLARAKHAAQACDLLLAVGTTLAVHPIASIVPLAKESGAQVVIMNGEPTAMDHLADQILHGPISELLPRIVGGTD